MDLQYLSIQDILLRTIHGYIGLIKYTKGFQDKDLLDDLKEVCIDVKSAKIVGEYTYEFIPMNNNIISEKKLNELKNDYQLIEKLIDKINYGHEIKCSEIKSLFDGIINTLKKEQHNIIAN